MTGTDETPKGDIYLNAITQKMRIASTFSSFCAWHQNEYTDD
jgi:hypothetical protein